jgi:hypothetical protein
MYNDYDHTRPKAMQPRELWLAFGAKLLALDHRAGRHAEKDLIGRDLGL